MGMWAVACSSLRDTLDASRDKKHEVFMETAELKGLINDLEARMTKIRDWL